MIWWVQNEYFSDLGPRIIEKNDEFYYCSKLSVKPLYFDDLYWDLMYMTSNKNQPLNLRAVAAFTMPSINVKQEMLKMKQLELFELEHCIREDINNVVQLVNEIKDNNDDWFYNLEKQLYDDKRVSDKEMRLIVKLHFKEYQQALGIIKSISAITIVTTSLLVIALLNEYMSIANHILILNYQLLENLLVSQRLRLCIKN